MGKGPLAGVARWHLPSPRDAGLERPLRCRDTAWEGRVGLAAVWGLADQCGLTRQEGSRCLRGRLRNLNPGTSRGLQLFTGTLTHAFHGRASHTSSHVPDLVHPLLTPRLPLHIHLTQHFIYITSRTHSLTFHRPYLECVGFCPFKEGSSPGEGGFLGRQGLPLCGTWGETLNSMSIPPPIVPQRGGSGEAWGCRGMGPVSL